MEHWYDYNSNTLYIDGEPFWAYYDQLQNSELFKSSRDNGDSLIAEILGKLVIIPVFVFCFVMVLLYKIVVKPMVLCWGRILYTLCKDMAEFVTMMLSSRRQSQPA